MFAHAVNFNLLTMPVIYTYLANQMIFEKEHLYLRKKRVEGIC